MPRWKKLLRRGIYGLAGLLAVIWVFVALEMISNSDLFEKWSSWALIALTLVIIVLIVLGWMMHEKVHRQIIKKVRGRG